MRATNALDFPVGPREPCQTHGAPASLPGTADSSSRLAWIAHPALASPRHLVLAAMIGGTALRIWRIDAVGYNSDEAVYAGQAASWVNDPEISPYFPLVRAHPMLFQFILAVSFQFGVNDLVGRLVSVAFGLGTLLLVYLLGRTMYTAWVGAVAALFLALMPYHVVVTRQVLLDGPLTFFSTLTVFLLAKYATTMSPRWLWVAGAGMGLTFYAKESGIILIAAVYAFLALSPGIRVRLRDLAIASFFLMAIVASYPISLALAGGGASEKARGYLIWQLLRQPNHEWTFYPATVPPAMGLLVVAAAIAGLWWFRRQHSWRETLLLAWIAVPAMFFQLWPVKGFQYLLPAAPCVAILAARRSALVAPDVARLARPPDSPGPGYHRWRDRRFARAAVVGRRRDGPVRSAVGWLGWGPGGRETGAWIQANAPEGAIFLCVGPSMANLVQFYGHRAGVWPVGEPERAGT